MALSNNIRGHHVHTNQNINEYNFAGSNWQNSYPTNFPQSNENDQNYYGEYNRPKVNTDENLVRRVNINNNLKGDNIEVDQDTLEYNTKYVDSPKYYSRYKRNNPQSPADGTQTNIKHQMHLSNPKNRKSINFINTIQGQNVVSQMNAMQASIENDEVREKFEKNLKSKDQRLFKLIITLKKKLTDLQALLNGILDLPEKEDGKQDN